MASPSGFEYSSIITGPYNAVRGGIDIAAKVIHDYSPDVVATIGKGISIVLKRENGETFTSAMAFIGFTALSCKGAIMVLTPLTSRAKWFTIENRFVSKKEIKFGAVNLPANISNIQAQVTPPSSSALLTAANHANTHAASTALAAANANAVSTTATNAATAAVNANAANPTPANAAANAAAATAARIAANAAQMANATANTAANVAATANAAATGAPLPASPTVSLTPAPLPPNTLPFRDNMFGASIEKTKKKAGETHINLPLSNQAFVIKHEEMKKAFIMSLAGLPIVATGVLGAADSIEDLYGSDLIPKPLHSTASFIGAPVQLTTFYVGKTLEWITHIPTLNYGIGNLGAAIGLSYAGYRALKATDFVWFDFNRANRADSIIKTDVIVKDIVKVAGGVAMISAAIFSANEFLSGNKI